MELVRVTPMSAPDPVTRAASGYCVTSALPEMPTLPMSSCDHPGGAGGMTATLSNVAVASVPWTWLETASPTSTSSSSRENVSVPSAVHPSVEDVR